MYLDQYSILALEYHYYQSDCKYSKLVQCEEHINEQGIWVDSKNPDQPVKHKLATEKYQGPGEDIHPMSSFLREDLRNYKDSNVDILKR